MSLYGSMFSGVSGLNAQSSSIAMISDNIANINTDGYKGTQASFATLVTAKAQTSGYSSGGVIASPSQKVNKGGIARSTGVNTDLSISGNGFFAVNSSPDGKGEFSYTRAGSFNEDSRGRLRNAAGFYLMAWPLDNEGRLPGEGGNLNTTSSALLDSLEPVNVKSVSGNASQTTKVDLGANLKSSQISVKGSGSKISFPSNSKNYNIDATKLIVPDDTGGIIFAKSDKLILTPSGEPDYGTYKASKSLNAASLVAGVSDVTTVFSGLYTTGGGTVTNNDSFTITPNGGSAYTFTFKTAGAVANNGEFDSLTTLAAAINTKSDLTARIQDNRLYVASKNLGTSIAFADVGSAKFVADLAFLDAAAPMQSFQFEYGGFAESGAISSSNVIAGANSENTLFGGNYTTGSGAINNGDKFKITTTVAGTEVTYDYIFAQASPTTSNGQFNNLTTLAEAINKSSGLTARIVDSKLYVANKDANKAVTFVDVGSAKFVADLGLADIIEPSGNIKRYATLQDLSNKISEQQGLEARVNNPLDGSSIEFYTTDPQGVLTINAAKALSNSGTPNNILSQLGIKETAGTILASAYSATDSNKNLASGKVQAHLSRNIRIYDAFGTGHDLQVSFAKLKANTWAVEIYAINKGEIISSRLDGQIAAGQIEFNGDGTLRNVSSSLLTPAEIIWENEAVPSLVTFNFGTAGDIAGTIGSIQIGKSDGLRQLDSDYQVDLADQNGISASLRNGVEIDKDGNIIAKFINGTSRRIYQTPVADFTSPNNLEAKPGNTYGETNESGTVNLKKASSAGAGKISPGTLEQANVELSDELTRMIIAQRGYQANSTVIKTVNDMLAELKTLA
jgi:flagellar hook protein FlgE